MCHPARPNARTASRGALGLGPACVDELECWSWCLREEEPTGAGYYQANSSMQDDYTNAQVCRAAQPYATPVSNKKPVNAPCFRMSHIPNPQSASPFQSDSRSEPAG